jgi:hypothetical protein
MELRVIAIAAAEGEKNFLPLIIKAPPDTLP